MYLCVVTAVEYVPSIISSTHINIYEREACSYVHMYLCVFKEKSEGISRPSEHPSVREKMSRRLDEIIGCKYKTS